MKLRAPATERRPGRSRAGLARKLSCAALRDGWATSSRGLRRFPCPCEGRGARAGCACPMAASSALCRVSCISCLLRRKVGWRGRVVAELDAAEIDLLVGRFRIIIFFFFYLIAQRLCLMLASTASWWSGGLEAAHEGPQKPAVKFVRPRLAFKEKMRAKRQ